MSSRTDLSVTHNSSGNYQPKRATATSWARHLNKPRTKLLSTILAFAVMMSGLLLGSNLSQQAQAADPWPNSGKPGTVQGRAYIDTSSYVEVYNPVLGDRAIPGVKMNAYLVKSDGTVIKAKNPDGTDRPFQVTTDEKGFYSFNFRPYMEAAYHGKGKGWQLKIASGDRIRVWPDDSNYKEGGALHGLTPKRLNGGERLTEVTTLTLSWLGTTNTIHGSISNMNMAFRPETPRVAEANVVGSNSSGAHYPHDQWKPTRSHDIATGLHTERSPYLCGHVYSDMTFRFDRWNGRNITNPKEASPDKVVPGVRVAMTTYAVDWLGNPERKLETRYDYTDSNGRFCIAWDNMDQFKNRFNYSGRNLLTIEPPTSAEEAKADLEALRPNSDSHAYDSITPLLDTDGNGLPDGYSATGANGWNGQIYPVDTLLGVGIGYNNIDVACVTRHNYCLPDLLWTAIGKSSFVADGADLGLIPDAIEAIFSRNTSEFGTERHIDVTIKNTNVLDPGHQVVMVAKGQDPTNPDNWLAVSDYITGEAGKDHTGNLTIPKDVPVGDYSLYTYSSKGGQIDKSQLLDVDPYRITNTVGHYYDNEADQNEAIEKLKAGELPKDSVYKIKPGTQLHNAYEDLGEKSYQVVITAPDQPATSGTVLDSDLKRIENPIANETNTVQTPYAGKDSFTIAQNTEPGDYDLVIVDPYGEEVDRQAILVTGPQITVQNPTVNPGASVPVDVTDLNPDTEYQVIYRPGGTGDPIIVDVPAHDDGTSQVTINVPNDDSYLGVGTVEIVKKSDPDKALDTASLNVTKEQLSGPQIILPGFKHGRYSAAGTNSDGFVGFPSEKGFDQCTDDASCLEKYHLPFKAHRYWTSISGISNRNLYVYAQNWAEPKGQRFIQGGVNDSRYEWSMVVKRYNDRGELEADDDLEKGRIYWDISPSDHRGALKYEPIAQNHYYAVTLTIKDKKTGLGDTKTFAMQIGIGGEPNYGKMYESPAAMLRVGQEVTVNDGYCVKKRPDETSIGGPNPPYHKATAYNPGVQWGVSAPSTDGWPQGLDIDAKTGCLVGTPTQVTNGWVDLLARDNDSDGNHDWGYSVNTIRVNIKDAPDEQPPTLTGENTSKQPAQAIDNDGVIKVHQGEALPLKVTGTDDKQLTSLKLATKANELPAGISAPNADPALDSDTVKTSALDFAGQKVDATAKPGNYPLRFVATDKAGNLAEYTVNVHVVKAPENPLRFGDGVPDNGTEGVPYGPDGNGWKIPIEPEGAQIVVSDGQLPPGLSIVTVKNGDKFENRIKGVPEKEGTYEFDLTIRDKDGNTLTKHYTITISPAPNPQWTDETNAIPDEITLEVGRELTQEESEKYTFATTEQNGQKAVVTVTDPSATDDNPKPELPVGLSLNDKGQLTGTPKIVDQSGTLYRFTAAYGEKKITKDVTIKVVDTTPPVVRHIPDAVVPAGNSLKIPLISYDNSAEKVSYSDLSCTGDGKTLPVNISGNDTEGYFITSDAIGEDKIGNYSCTFNATDPYSNTTKSDFKLTIRPAGPWLIAIPAEQTVDIDPHGGTDIKTVTVENEEGSELNVEDCTSKLPSTITWNADTKTFSGKLVSLTNVSYTCNITATKDDKTSTQPVTINGKGAVTGPTDEEGNLAAHGRVGKEFSQTDPFQVVKKKDAKDPSLTISAEQAKKLKEYGLTFNESTGKFEGTPSKATYTGTTPAAVTITLTGDQADGSGTFDVPVKLTIDPAANVTNIPTSATVGQKFTPTINNPQDGVTYTVKICAEADTECANPIVSGAPGSELTIPEDATGTLNVKVVDSEGTTISANTDTIAITPIDLVKSDGSAIPTEMKGGSTLDTKLVNPTTGANYTVKLCKKSDTKCENPITTKQVTADNPNVDTITIPVNGSDNADPNGEYQVKVFKGKGTTPVITKPITATAGDADLSNNAHSNFKVTKTGTTNVANGQDSYTINVKLADDAGNPVTGKATALNASQSGLTAAKVTLSEFTESTTKGTYTATITSTEAGTATVSVRLDKSAVTLADKASDQAVFVAGPLSAEHSTARVSVNGQAANNTAEDQITVELKDAHDNPITGATITHTDDAALPLTWGTVTESTTTPGTYTVGIKSAAPGSSQVQMKVGDTNIGDALTINFVPGTPADSTSTVTIDAGPKKADNTEFYTVTVQVKEAGNHPLSGVSVTAAASPADGVTLSTPTESKDTRGTYTFTVKSTKSGDKTITVTIGEGNSAVTKTVTATFTPLGPSSVEFNGIPGNATSGEEICKNDSCSITVNDENGNPVANGTKVWVKVPGTTDPIEVTIGDNGTAILDPFTPGLITDNTVRVYPDKNGAADKDNELGKQTINLTPGAPDATNTSFTASPESPVTGNEVEVTGVVKDAAGNPIPNRTMTVQVPNGNGGFDNVEVVTDENGNLKPSAAGKKKITFTAGTPGVQQTTKLFDGSDTSGDPLKTASVTPVEDSTKTGVPVVDPDNPTAASHFTLSTGPKEANHSDAYTITVMLKDTYDHAVTGAASNLTAFTETTGFTTQNTTFSAFTEVTGTPGKYTATVSSGNPGTAQIKVNYSKDSTTIALPTDEANKFEKPALFVVGDLSSTNSTLVVKDSAGTPISGTEKPAEGKSVKSGDTVTIVYTPKDDNGHPVDITGPVKITVPGYDDPIELTKNGNEWTGTVVVKKSGVNTLTSQVKEKSDSQPAAGPSAKIQVNAGDPNGTNSSIALKPDTPVSPDSNVPVENTDVTVDSTVKDSNDNPVPNHKVTVQVIQDGKDPVTIPAITNKDGKVVDPKTKKPIKVTVGDQGDTTTVKIFDGENNTSGDPLVQADTTPGKDPDKIDKPFVPADKSNTHSVVSIDNRNNVLADNADYHTVTVTLKNSYGDALTGLADKLTIETVTDSFKDSGSTKILTFFNDGQPDGKFIAVENSDGNYSIKVKSTKIGTADLKVKFVDGTTELVIPSVKSTADKVAETVPAPYIAGAVNKDQSTLKVTIPGSDADQTTVPAGTEVTITLTPKDANGHKVDLGDNVTVNVPGVENPVTLTKQPDGTYVGTATPTTATGTDNNQITFPADSPLNGKTHELNVTPGSPSTATVPNVSVVKNTPVSNKEVTGITDAHGNPVADGTKVYIKVPGSDTWQEVEVTDGKATIPTFTPTADGTIQVASDDQGTNVIGSGTVTVTIGNPDKTNSTISLVPDRPVSPDSNVPVENTDVTVDSTVKDSAGNPIPDRNVTVTVKTGDGDTVTIPAVTNENGKVVDPKTKKPIKVTVGNPGEKTVVKIFDGDTTTGDPLVQAETTPGKDGDRTGVPVFADDGTKSNVVMETYPDTRKADGTEYHVVKVTLVDYYGDPVTGKTGQIRLSKTDDSINATIGTLSETPANSGIYKAHVTSLKAGFAKINAVYVPQSNGARAANVLIPGSAVQGEFVAGDAAKVVWPKDENKKDKPINGVVGNETDSPGKITITDANDNPVGPGVTVKIKVPGQTDPVTVTTDENGQVDIPAFTPDSTTDNKITVTDENGKKLGEKTVNVREPAKPDAPGLDVKRTDDGGLEIVVTPPADGTDGAKPEVCLTKVVDGKKVCEPVDPDSVVDNGDGTFKVVVPPKDSDGVVSVTTTVTSPEGGKSSTTKPVPPKVTVTENEDGSATVVVTPADPDQKPNKCETVDGEKKCTPIEPDENGDYKVVVPAEDRDDPVDVVVNVTDPDGNNSDDTTVIVNPKPKAPKDVVANGTTVTGKVDPSVPAGSKITVKDKDGKVIGTGEVADDHTFVVTYPEQPDKSVINVTVTDPNTNVTSDPTPAVVDNSIPTKPSINVDKNNPDVVNGKVDKGDKVTVCVTKKGTDKPVCKDANVDKDGNYDVKLDDPLKDGDKVVVTTTDPDSGNSASNEKVVDFTAPDQPTDIKISKDGTVVSGKGEPGANVTITLPDGTKVTGVVDENGDFKIKLPKPLANGDKITIVLTDQAGNSSDPLTVIFKILGKGKPVALPATGGQGAWIPVGLAAMLITLAAAKRRKRSERV